jgi:hypothetical protein
MIHQLAALPSSHFIKLLFHQFNSFLTYHLFPFVISSTCHSVDQYVISSAFHFIRNEPVSKTEAKLNTLDISITEKNGKVGSSKDTQHEGSYTHFMCFWQIY